MRDDAGAAAVAEDFNRVPDRESPEMAWWRAAMATKDARLDWWREARFGMFVHWGVYSPLSGEWEGKPYRGYAEHLQRMAKIPIPVYREKVLGAFRPTAFDADAWIRLAKEAGMKYFVITAKHHDGVAMYDSKVSDYNVVKGSPWKRDPMRDLKAACDRHGIKFGFYYSHAFDWGDADGPGNDWDYENPGGDRGLHGGRNWWEHAPNLMPKVHKYVDGKSIPQIEELIRGYDPAILWFDTPHKLPPSENWRILRATRAAGPNVVINGRLLRGSGDYASTTDRPAEFPPNPGDWEGIPTTNESYGYSRVDRSHKPPAHFVQLLAKAAARGGNLLMNVGPMGDGRIDPADVEILKGIGAWMRVNGESIHGTERTPLPVQPWGESTRKGDGTLYLHIFHWPEGGVPLTVGGLLSDVKRAYLLADPAQTPLHAERVSATEVRLTVPGAAPDPWDAVIVVETEGAIRADASALPLAPGVPNRLRAFDGVLGGDGKLRFGAGKRENAYAENWTSVGSTLSWPVCVTAAADYFVALAYDAEEVSAGGTFTVTAAGQTITGTVRANKGQPIVHAGHIRLEPGTHTITVTPTKIEGPELMRLRYLTLLLVGSWKK